MIGDTRFESVRVKSWWFVEAEMTGEPARIEAILGTGIGKGTAGIIGGRNRSGPEVDGIAGKITGPETGTITWVGGAVNMFVLEGTCARRAVVMKAWEPRSFVGRIMAEDVEGEFVRRSLSWGGVRIRGFFSIVSTSEIHGGDLRFISFGERLPNSCSFLKNHENTLIWEKLDGQTKFYRTQSQSRTMIKIQSTDFILLNL